MIVFNNPIEALNTIFLYKECNKQVRAFLPKEQDLIRFTGVDLQKRLRLPCKFVVDR